jgi:hypothetical protein
VTRLGIRVAYEPSGEPVGSQMVRVKNCASGATLAVGITDSDGLATWAVDANPGPAYFQITGVPGGDRTWDSRDAFNAGIVPMSDIPVVLRGLDGVVGAYIGELEVALGTGNTVTLASGCAVLLGHPVVNLGEQTIAITRPGSLTRIDRVVARLYPQEAATTPGYAVFALLAGTEGGSAPDLTQSADVWEISLAQVSVPVADPITVTDERTYANQRADVTAEVLDDTTSTTSAAGEALSGLSTSLTLSRAATYDIEATLTARQTSITAGAAGWGLQTTVSTLNSVALNGPQGLGRDSSDNVYICDTIVDRVVKVNSAGTYQSGVTSINEPAYVCVDASDNIYVTCNVGADSDDVRKYNSSWVAQATSSLFFGEPARGVAQDGTYLYVCYGHAVRRVQLSDLTTTGEWGNGGANHDFGSRGTAGATTARLNTPHGCVVSGLHLYVVDSGNSRVMQLLLSDGSYDSNFAIAAGGRGIDITSGGNLVVAESTGTDVTVYTTAGVVVSTFTQVSPYGVAALSDGTVWVANTSGDSIALWEDFGVSGNPGGYGTVAVAFDGTPGTYTGIGEVDGVVTNSHVTTAVGPTSVTVAAFGKRTSETLTLESACLNVRAVPRR